MNTIRTPDQRLRVFISSTIKELGSERAAAQRAVTDLRLSPILFELGARPHPPRQLYRAYLEQSDIFVGIYWQSYGWVAPDMEISGLEDEYECSGGKPKLIYVKGPAPAREEGLAALLDRIRDRDDVSYKPFETADELERLIQNDLASLLSERFEASKPGETVDDESRPPSAASGLPARVDRFIGRDRELEELRELVTRRGDRLITLSGPGGIGKSRLAVELASRCRDEFENGVCFVALGAVTDPDLVVASILQTLGVQASASDSLTALIDHLRVHDMLLLLDNFEQVVPAAADVARVVEECSRITVVVTSRAILNLRSEREFPVPPLGLPPHSGDLQPLAVSEAVRLFVDRARGTKSDFDLTEGNAAAVAEICRRLDGLPLALELAAARVRLLSPDAMLDRLDASLQLLTGGSRDVPERHQTLRAAIDWSFGLLTEDEKKLFVRLGVFRGGFTLDAAEAVCNAIGDLDLLDLMTSLLEKSLIKYDLRGIEPRFGMLQTVWEYAAEGLAGSADAASVRAAHTSFFMDQVAASYDGLRSSAQTEWMTKLEAENGNLRTAIRSCFDAGEIERVAEAGWTLWLFWWINAHLSEGRQLMNEALERGGMSELGHAKAAAVAGVMAFWQGDYGVAVPLLGSAVETMRNAGDKTGVALCQLPLGFVESAAGSVDAARARFEESISLFKEVGDDWGTVISLNAFCWTAIAVGHDIGDDVFEEAVERGRRLGTDLEYGMALRNFGGRLARTNRLEEARDLLARALAILWRGYIRGGSSYTIDAIAEIAAEEGEAVLATRLYGGVQGVRDATGAPIVPMLIPRHDAYIAKLRRDLGDDVFEREWATGVGLGLDATARLALDWAGGVRDPSEGAEAVPR